MQPVYNPPATIVVLGEKEPLLPLNGQPVIVNAPRSGAKSWLKEHIPRALVYGLFFYIVFNAMNTPYLKWNSHDQDISIKSASSLDTLQDVVNYNNDVLNSGIIITCRGGADGPSIPFEGESEFEFDQEAFPRLTIDQKTNTNRGRSLQITNGNTVVSVDETLSKVFVKFDIKFDSEDLQDVLWIDQTQDEEQGIYSLIVRADEYYNDVACIAVNIDVRVPNVAALTTLAISLSNNGISLKKGLTFENLAISIANGHVEFEDGISSGITTFAVANGHVSGQIDTLSNDLTSSLANGHTEISIKSIDQSNAENISIKATCANGHNEIKVPASFNSQFQLESFSGRRIVESNDPRSIHRRPGRWGSTSGYYGDDKDTNNSVTLRASNGNLKLTYV